MRVVSAGEYLKKYWPLSHNFDAHPSAKQMNMTDKQPATCGSNKESCSNSNNTKQVTTTTTKTTETTTKKNNSNTVFEPSKRCFNIDQKLAN